MCLIMIHTGQCSGPNKSIMTTMIMMIMLIVGLKQDCSSRANHYSWESARLDSTETPGKKPSQ